MKRSFHFCLFLLVAAALSFAACGGSAESGGGASGQVAAIDENKLVRIGTTSYPTNANPFSQSMQADNTLQDHIYDGLSYFKIDDTSEFTGVLAESWSVTADGLVWTVNLRQDVVWHDGEVFDAEDVAFTYNTLIEANKPENEAYEFRRKVDVKAIESIEVVDPYTIKFHCSVPKADFELEPMQTVRIVPEHIWSGMNMEEIASFQNPEPVGTGSFKLTKPFNPQDQTLLVARNAAADSWRPAKADGLLFILFENKDTMYQAFQNGDIFLFNPNSTQADELRKEDAYTVNAMYKGRVTEFGFNSYSDPNDRFMPHPDSKGNPLLVNPNIRKAIDFALDKQFLVDNVWQGNAMAGTTIVPPAAGKWHLPSKHEFNPEKAIAMLEAEGFTEFVTENVDGNEIQVRANGSGDKLIFRLALLNSGYAWHYRDSTIFINQWLNDVGIGLQIETMDGNSLGSRSDDESEAFSDFDLFIWGWTFDDYAPSFALSVLTTDEIGGRSDSLYSNREYDELQKQQLAEAGDPARRLEIVHLMQEIIWAEVPYSILYYQSDLEAFRNDKVTGLIPLNNNGTIYNKYSYVNMEVKQ